MGLRGLLYRFNNPVEDNFCFLLGLEFEFALDLVNDEIAGSLCVTRMSIA
jgi:hypothetical protein